MVIAYDEDTVQQYMKQAVDTRKTAPCSSTSSGRCNRSRRRCTLRRRRRGDRRHHAGTSKKRAFTPATRPACCPPSTYPRHCSSACRDYTFKLALCSQSNRSDERAIRHPTPLACLEWEGRCKCRDGCKCGDGRPRPSKAERSSAVKPAPRGRHSFTFLR